MMVWLLFAINAVNYLDRQVLSLLLEAVRVDLGLNDFQLGLMSGLAFSLVYAVASVPATLWAMTGNRRTLVGLSAILWGSMTVLGGVTTNFLQFALTRAGIALGEAGFVPASHSIVSDGAAEGRRVRILGHLISGAPVGGALAFVVGGLIGQAYGWRVAMIVAGLPGIVLGALLFLLREPERPHGSGIGRPRPGGLASQYVWVFGRLLRCRPARAAFVAETVNHVVLAGALAWYPTFLKRAHHFTETEIAGLLFVGAVLAIAGTVVSARVVEALRQRSERWLAWAPAVITLFVKPFSLLFLLAADPKVSVMAFVVPAALSMATYAPTISIMHAVVAPWQRPAASAILLSIATVVGTALGPGVVGFVSAQGTAADGESLRHALVGLQLFGLASSVFYFSAGADRGPGGWLDRSDRRDGSR